MSDEVNTSSSKLTGSAVLDNQRVYDLLISKINDQVNENVQKKFGNARNWILGILTIIVLISIEGIPFILKNHVDDAVKHSVEESVNFSVKEAVDSAIKETEDAIRFDLEVTSLNIRVLNLDRSERFNSGEAQSIIQTIKSLVSEGGEKRLPEFAGMIDTAVKNFAEAGQLNFVSQLQNIAPDLFLNSDIIIQTMLQANGFILLADAGAPTSWTDLKGSRRESYTTYRRYMNRAESAGHPELYLLYEMLLGYIEERSKDEINELIKNTGDLDIEDAEQFVRIMTALARGETVRTPTANSKRAASRVTEFLCRYKDQGKLLHEISQRAELQC